MFCGAFENEWDYPKIHEHCLIIDYKLKNIIFILHYRWHLGTFEIQTCLNILNSIKNDMFLNIDG